MVSASCVCLAVPVTGRKRCRRCWYLITAREWLCSVVLVVGHSPTVSLSGVRVCTLIIINPFTARVVGAPQMILQPISSIFPCSPLLSGTCWSPGLHTIYRRWNTSNHRTTSERVTELATPFILFLVSFSVSMALSTRSINFPNHSPLSHYVLLDLFLPCRSFRLYILFTKVSVIRQLWFNDLWTE